MAPTLAERLISAAPTLVAVALAAAAFYFRATAQAVAAEKIALALKEVVDPLAQKLDGVRDAIGNLDKTLAVQQEKHLALEARFDRAGI